MEHLTVAVDEATSEVLYDLEDWLRQEHIDGAVVERDLHEPGAGEMGAGSDILSVVLGSGSVIALVESIHVWLRYRQPKVSVRLQRRATGDEVTVTSQNAEQASEIIRALGI